MSRVRRQNVFNVAVIALISFCVALCTSLARHTKENSQFGLIIHNVTAIDSSNGVMPNVNVIIQGDQIVDVAQNAEAELAHAKRIIDGQGKYLIPGLWDAHVHLRFDEKISDSMFRLFIANGITSVRDTGG